jgi:VWFA-related protein
LPEENMKKRIGIGVLLEFVCILTLSFLTVNAQDTPPSPATQGASSPSNAVPVIHATSRLVLLDVIVTDHSGKFVPGLKAGDFTVFEDKQPQKISAFAVNVAPAAPAKPFPPLQLPPHMYTNFTFIKPDSDRPVSVVLMDMLNTSGMDQAYARKQMIQFLKDLPPGRPIALFVLTTRLKMIQGFSGDSGVLIAAAKALLGYQSPFLSPEGQQQQEENGATALENNSGAPSSGPGGPNSASSMPIAPIGQAIREALDAQDSFQKIERMDLTLHALDVLAQSVAGYPGRKNLIWLSAEFPVTFGPDMTPYNQASHPLNENVKNETNHQIRDLETEAPPVQQTAALLAAARMAVYPVDVRGQISMGTGIDISAPTSGLSALDMQNEVGTTYGRQTAAIWDAHEAMSDVARETGGHAFYGTNDLKNAMARSVEQGSSYYTLAYAPANHDWSGKYRKIEVKATTPGIDLTYRRGYYALQEHELGTGRAAAAMTAAMQPTVPEFTGLLLKVQVLPPDAEHENVRIDYAVDAHDISFTDGADQRKKATIDFVATAWDKDFKQAGRVAGGMDTTLRPEAYQQVMHTGLPFHQEMELKPGTYTLRLGVLDRGSHKIGSVEAPITIPGKGNASISQKSR